MKKLKKILLTNLVLILLPTFCLANLNSLSPDELDNLDQYTKTCEETKLNLVSCNKAFDEANAVKPGTSFWYSPGGEVLKGLLFIGLGVAITKAWEQNQNQESRISPLNINVNLFGN